MKKVLILILLFYFLGANLKAQVNMDTPNLSFDDGSLNGWSLFLGEYYYDTPNNNYKYDWTPVSPATSNGRISIINNLVGTNDPIVACSGFYTNPDNKLVARIGVPKKAEGNINYPIAKKAAAERLEYSFIASANSTLLSYKLAAVLKVPTGDTHKGDQLPSYSMNITVTDNNGVSYSLPCCSYSSKADNATTSLTRNSACASSTSSNPTDYVYKEWISGNVDLSKQIGKRITITILTHDCLRDDLPATDVAGSHEAYGYFRAQTSKIELSTFSCENSDATIYAPEGFSTYNWTRSDGKPITTPDPTRPYIVSIDKSLNVEGIVYSCELNDINSGCGSITVSTTIKPAKLHPDFTSVAVDAGKLQFTDISTAEGDSITDYYWDFGDGSFSALRNPAHIYSEFIPFNVKLTTTSKKGCSKTISHNILPTKELHTAIYPPSNLEYNGQTKDFTATTNIAGLQMNIDYYIRYSNKPGTDPYNSYTAPSNAGDYNATFELSYLSLLKYFMTSIPSLDFTITKAPLMITADDVTKQYGEKINLLREAFTQDRKPLFAGDKIYELELTCFGLNDTASVGQYPIVPTKAFGLGINNYNIQFVPGKLTVNKKSIHVSALDASKTYGEFLSTSGKEFYIAPKTLVGKDTINHVDLHCSGLNEISNIGNYRIRISNAQGKRLDNYEINYVDATLIINKRKITVTANTINKEYGSEYSFSGQEFSTDLSQFAGNDSIAGVQFATTAMQKNIAVGDYPLSITSISGNRLDNYDIKFLGSTFGVMPKTISITPNNLEKEYGDLLTFNGHEFSTNPSLIGGDTITFLLLKSSGSIGTANIGEYDIKASSAYGLGMLNYNFNYVAGKLNVVKKKLIPTIYPPTNLNYNGYPKDFTATLNISGLFQNVDYLIHYSNRPGTAFYNSYIAPSNAGNYSATFELSTLSQFNYYITDAPSEDFTISKAPLTITADDATKIYGNRLNILKYAFKTDLKPLYGSDAIFEVEFTCNGLADTVSVGTYPITPVNVIGNGTENYDIHFATGKLTIKPKGLIISAINSTKEYGNKTTPNGTEFYIDPLSLVGSDRVESVTLTSSGYNPHSTVGSYPIEISNATGNRLNNYQVSYTNASLDILKKKITVIANVISKIYGKEYLFTGNEFSTDYSQFVNNDTITSVQISSPASNKETIVGEYKSTINIVNGNGLENYDIKLVNNTFDITPMPVNITANSIVKRYGELLTFNGSEFSSDQPLLTGDSISFVLLKSIGSSETATVGNYDIYVSKAYGVGILNYNFTYLPGQLQVIKTEVIANILPPTNLGYNAQPKEFSAILNFQKLTLNNDYFILYTSRNGTSAYNSYLPPSAAGDYTASLVLSRQSQELYYLNTLPSLNFSITKAPLTIEVDNVSKTYGDKLILQKSAFKTNNTVLFGNDIITDLDFNCIGLDDTTSVGTYTISPKNARGSGIENYNIQYVNGLLTVNKRPLTLKTLTQEKTYGDNLLTSVNGFYVDGNNLVGSDKVTSVKLNSDGYNQLAVVGTYPLKASDATGIGLINYQISYSDGVLQVLKRKITVSAKPTSKVYGSEYLFRGNEFETDTTQLIGSDKIYDVKLNSLATQKKATVGIYTLAITLVSGFGLENYDIKMMSNLFEIKPMPILVTAKNQEKEYGDVLTLIGNEFTTNVPLVNSDTLSFVFMNSKGFAETSPMGEYEITPSQGYGNGSLNYAITYRNGKLNVTKKQLFVKAVNIEKEYGEKDPKLTFSVVDKNDVAYQSSLFSGNIVRQMGENVGTYAITQGTLSIPASYVYNFTNGELIIKKALPSINALFMNENGQFITADVIGSRNGKTPQGKLNVKINPIGFNQTSNIINGECKCPISGLPTEMVVVNLEYLGDENYLPVTVSLKVYAIIYHTNGGTLYSPITNFDATDWFKLETPSNDNSFKFGGWYKTEDFTGDQIRQIPAGTSNDVHLYAKWTEIYSDLSIVVLFNQVLAVANPRNRDFLYHSTYKWYKDGVQIDNNKQYCGFENYVPSGVYRVEIYYANNDPIVLEFNHTSTIQKSKIYPNPLSKKSDLTINTYLSNEKNVTLEVYNSLGLKETNLVISQNNNLFRLKGFSKPGIYIIYVMQNGEIKETHKVIVEN